VLDVRRELGELQRQLGDDEAAIDSYRKAIPISAALVRQDPTNTDWQYQLGNLMSDFGFALSDHGQFKDGLVQLSDAMRVHQDLIARDPKSSKYKIALSRSQTRAGDAHLYLGQLDDAIAQYRAALDIRRELVDSDAKSVAYRRSIAWSYAKLAKAFILQGNDKTGMGAHEEALKTRQQLVAESPSQGSFKNELASSEIELGRLLVPTNAKRSDELIKQGVARARNLVVGDMINNEWKETLTQGLIAQAVAARDQAVRRASYAEALGIAEQAAQRAPQNAHWPGYLAEIHTGLAESSGADAKTAKAEWKRVVEILEPLEKEGRLPATRKPLLDRARTRT
jgi:tetratricopeptide (TPR) repeat protein